MSSSYSIDSCSWQQLSMSGRTAPAGAASFEYVVKMYDVSAWAGDATVYLDDAGFIGQTAAVRVSSFAAVTQRNSILLQWKTVAEPGNRGFNVYRSEGAQNPRKRLNASLIPSKGSGGSSYQFADRAVEARAVPHYWLEDVNVCGAKRLHGPVRPQQLATPPPSPIGR